MRIAGIVAEYNPFHNGHAHHIRRTREETDCDYVVVCLAGHFTQRGEPAILSKWARTRMALCCGADAVFELPALFAVRPADAFARGGVGVLCGLGVDVLSFGCEIADEVLLRRLADLRDDEPMSFHTELQARLNMGMAHARAWGEAAGVVLGIPQDIVNQPNLTLAVEYLRALRRFAGVETAVIQRKGGYHDGTLGEWASASAVRAAFSRGEEGLAMESIPELARPWARPDDMHAMDDMLLYRLRGMDLDALRKLPGMVEGLEHRLYRLCRETDGREALLEALKCRRYTRARLSRMLSQALLGITQSELDICQAPQYARLLGIRSGAEPLLGELKRRASLPILSSAADLRGDPCFQAECRVTDVWSLLHDRPHERRAGREYREKFVRI